MRHRLEFLDIARGAGVLLVVMSHGGLLHQPAASWIYEFYMPLFFVITGYLSGRKDAASGPAAIRRRLASLIKSYFAGCGALFLLWFVLYPLRGQEWQRIGQAVFSILYGRMTDPANPYLADVCWTGPMWFLTLMTTAQALLYLVRRWDDGTLTRRALLAAGLLAAAQLLRMMPVLLPWCLDTAPMAALLMLVSGWLAQRRALEGPFSPGTAAACLLLAVPYVLLHDTYDLHLRYYGRWQDLRGTLAFFAAGLCGSLLFLMLCRLTARCTPLAKALGTVGRGSLAVFIGHTWVLWAVDSVFLRLPAFPLSALLRGAAILLAGTLVPLAGQRLVRRIQQH